MGFDKFNLDKVNQRLEAFKEQTIQAGILGGTYEDGTNIAYVAAIQEYGAPDVNIPPRPFMSTTVEARRKVWTKALSDGIAAAAAGQISASAVLEQVGALMAADIQKTISEIDAPALSQVTVMLRGMRSNNANLVMGGKTVGEAARRVADGEDNFGASTKPLVDTGILLKSISYKVGEAP
jgi:hypothetical protein